jgi:hypothetical protein
MRVATIRQSVAPRSRRVRWLSGAGSAGLLLAVLAGTAPAAARASRQVDRDGDVRQGPVQVTVKVAGRPAPLYHAWNHPDRWYLEAREGARYEVQVRNTTGQRVGFLLAVDGLNAIDGRRSALSREGPMYVLGPYESATIKGWRRSLSSVSRFVFVDEERSYAERTDQGNGDLGWIRVLAFYERQPEIRLRGEEPMRARPDGALPQAPEAAPPRAGDAVPRETGKAEPQDRGLGGVEPQARAEGFGGPVAEDSHPGTGWGSQERDRVRVVDFDPAQYAAAHVVLRYEYRPGLVALGVLPWRGGDPDRLWERENGLYGFAEPPRR